MTLALLFLIGCPDQDPADDVVVDVDCAEYAAPVFACDYGDICMETAQADYDAEDLAALGEQCTAGGGAVVSICDHGNIWGGCTQDGESSCVTEWPAPGEDASARDMAKFCDEVVQGHYRAAE